MGVSSQNTAHRLAVVALFWLHQSPIVANGCVESNTAHRLAVVALLWLRQSPIVANGRVESNNADWLAVVAFISGASWCCCQIYPDREKSQRIIDRQTFYRDLNSRSINRPALVSFRFPVLNQQRNETTRRPHLQFLCELKRRLKSMKRVNRK